MANSVREKTRYPGIVRIGDDKYEIRVAKGWNPVRQRYDEWIKVFHGTLSQAVTRQAEMRGEVVRRPTQRSTWTVSQLMDRYFEYAEGKLAYNTLRSDRGRWAIMKPFIGSKNLTAVNEMDIDDLLDAVQRSRGCKPQTINRYRAVLSAAFSQAKRWKLIKHSPMRDVESRSPVAFKRKLPSFEQIESLLKAYEKVNPEMGKLLKLTWLNSLRRSEACALRVCNLEPATGSLVVDKSVYFKRQSDGGGWHLKSLKNGEEKIITPVDDFSLELLTKLCEGRSSNDFLFSDDDGKSPWNPDTVTRSQQSLRCRLCPQCGWVGPVGGEACVTCEVPLGLNFRVHDLRAWTTTFLLRMGRSKAAQQRGGWKDESVMRSHYYAMTNEEGDAAAADINDLFRKGA